MIRPALCLAALLTATAARAEDATATLCRTNPAYAHDVISAILAEQLQHDHDPALDSETPDQMANDAVEQGVKDCAGALNRDQPTLQVMSSLSGADLRVGWDAFNTSCSDHVASKAACIRAEVGSVKALKHMASLDQPPGARSLLEACQLVLKPDPPMAEWRSCVDLALAAHADKAAAKQCKTNVAWHTTQSGAAAGKILNACLTGAAKH